MTAGVVTKRMSSDEFVAYMAGIVEGLAHARYERDGKDPAGRSCIYRWFYEADARPLQIGATFEHYGEHLPGAVVAAMIKKECGP